MPKQFTGMKVDGTTMGMGASAHRFAGQDGVQADAISETLGTLSEEKSLWQCIVWCLSDETAVQAVQAAAQPSLMQPNAKSILKNNQPHVSIRVVLISEGGLNSKKAAAAGRQQQRRADSR